MDIIAEITDDNLLEQVKRAVMEVQERVGRNFVENAKAEGNYRDRTGNLRRSNYYENHEDGLVVGNKADYASLVEAKGYEVSSTFALRAEAELKNSTGE